MTDTFSPEKRSWVMSRIKSGNTKPEIRVRSFLHRLGFRFSLRTAKLPGKPDIILRKHKAVVFVHGCFWHMCPHCKGGRLPKSNLNYWEAKFKRNQERDKANSEKLQRLGWKVITIWACGTDNHRLETDLLSQLSSIP